MRPSRSRRRFVASLVPLVLLLFLAAAGSGQGTAPSPTPSPAKEQTATGLRLPGWLRWLWSAGEKEKKPGDPAFELAQATVATLALLIAFLTVAELWQVPPPSTSLTSPSRAAKGKAAESSGSTSAGGEARTAPAARTTPNLFDSNFSRIILSGLGGLAVVSVADDLWKASGLPSKAYYFVLFVAFFLVGLAATALLRGIGEAVRSRITLNRPAVIWPPVPWRFKEKMPARYVALQWLRYWGRRFWYWMASFRATFLVFLDTTFNVLIGKNQLQSAVFSETITDLHEGLLQAAERVRDEVHRSVISALVRKGSLPTELPHEESIRVAVSLLSADESDLYYIAWERGSSPKRFGQHSLAWLAAFTGEARWMKLDPPGTPEDGERWLPIYRENPNASAIDNRKNLIPGHPRTRIPVGHFFEARGGEDYEGFIMLPMPWTHRGLAGEHRKGAIHISFREAKSMDDLWENLETGGDERPNYEAWKGLLQPSSCEAWPFPPSLVHRAERLLSRTTHPASTEALENLVRQARKKEAEFLDLYREVRALEKEVEKREDGKAANHRIAIKDSELCAVLHQGLEVLGEALAHFDDDVYNVYVRARQHPGMAPR